MTGVALYPVPGPPSIIRYYGQSGAKGSFAYGDTNRYAPGGLYDEATPGAGGGATTQHRAPGSNYGGAKISPPYINNSRNTPDGCVIIRLIQIV